ncbi:MAG: rhomboid family intramembrane serine protease [Chloroflexota bacterium]
MSTNEISLQRIGISLKSQLSILGAFVAIFWGLEAIDWVLGGFLDGFGVIPRTAVGLRGIVFGPFLHGGFGHLMANTVPFLVLGWFVLLANVRTFMNVTVITAVISGLGIWLIAPSNSVHIGASGLIFGYFGFLLLRGYFERSFSSIAWSLLVAVFYGGLIWGVLPQEVGISWQAHLFGFIGGGLAAYWLTDLKKEQELRDSIVVHE